MSPRPDLIVGIDLGMSCTGVSYINVLRCGLQASGIRVLNRWPNRIAENKVPTVVVYDSNDVSKGPTSWGFGSESESERGEEKLFGIWFKKRFCPSPNAVNDDQESFDERLPPVDTLYKDFLTKLYDHIKSHFPSSAFNGRNSDDHSWETVKVEFLFSVPATWNSVAIERFKRLARQAGFTKYPNHTISASLTEPQAAATFAIAEESEAFQNGENILIIDAGGGTVDLCLLNIGKKERGRISLSEIEPVSGDDAGSTYIDAAFEDLALARLQKLDPERLSVEPKHAAWAMMMSNDFQNNKHMLDGTAYGEEDVFEIRVPSLKSNEWMEEHRIERGEMQFRWGDLMRIFDEQVNVIERLIERMTVNASLAKKTKINHIILSGGLGSSKYVQARLEKFCKRRITYKALQDAIFHPSTDPQLCVCKGLLYDRLQTVQSGTPTFSRLCSQFSFGIVKMEKYNVLSKTHREAKKEGRVRVQGPKQEDMVHDCVEWFVIKGQPVNPEIPTVKPFRQWFGLDEPSASLVSRITVVSSKLQKPPSFLAPGVDKHATITCDFSALADSILPIKSGPWYSHQKRYREFHFVIEAKVGAAEVSFQCSSGVNGKQLSELTAIPVPIEVVNVEVPEAVIT